MKSIDLDQIYRFVSVTHQLRDVQRKIYAAKTNRMENDAEHQYQMALITWYLVDALELDLDKEKVLRYALIHDFVEVYAGDVGFFDPNRNEATKKENEKKAAQQLKKEFPEFKELHQMIDGYEARTDNESKFVHAMDKILPIWNMHLDGGKMWREINVTLPMLIDKKGPHAAIHPDTKKLFDETIKRLQKEENTLFGKH